LTQLAESSAERALALDAELADAHSALGLVQSRAGAWAMAKEHFDAALAIDPNAAAALEGLSCLLADVGQSRAALQVGLRAIALQPKNTGARECVAYAQLSVAGAEEPAPQETSAGTPRVRVLAALLSDDVTTARTLLRNSTNGDATQWTDPLLRAAADRSHIAAALQAITRAANDGHIDATTEILGGVALKQSDFVFNRMLRLHRKKEPVPLRLLWLQQTGFLRTHARFEQLISASSLASFWQDHSPPDVCSSEPSVYGCKLSAKGK
jgi:tetratricopeptide (TPR) repeat protein